MRDWTGKRYWLVGASEGLGEALAYALSRRGAELVLSARNEARLTEVAEALPGRAEIVTMDVADSASVRAAAETVGEIDGMVFLAGLYWPMHAQDWDSDRAERMADVNFTSAVRVLGQVVPGMVARGAGHIVLTGSLAGFRGLPGAIAYGASKAGVMSLAESLAADLRGSGVTVQLVNPGFIKTRLTAQNDFAMPMIMEAEDAARRMAEHMSDDGFERNFPTVFSWVFRLARLLPNSLYFSLFSR